MTAIASRVFHWTQASPPERFPETELVWLPRTLGAGFTRPKGPQGLIQGYQSAVPLALEDSPHFDLIELNFETETSATYLSAIPQEKRIICAYLDKTPELGKLKHLYETMRKIPAVTYKIVTTPENPLEALVPLKLLRDLNSRQLWTYAATPIGHFSHVLAMLFGSPYIAVSASTADMTQFGLITSKVLREVYDYPNPLPPVTHVLGILGSSTLLSQAPLLHNQAYRQHALPYLYLPFVSREKEAHWIREFIVAFEELFAIPIQGLTVVAPFKARLLDTFPDSSEVARQVHSANLLYRKEGQLWIDSADVASVLKPLEDHGVQLAGHSVAIIGSGGAARAAALALQSNVAKLEVFCRDPDQAKHFPTQDIRALSTFKPDAFDLIVHATPIGKTEDHKPFDPVFCRPDTLILEFVYRLDGPTPLVKAAQRMGLHTIDGHEVLNASTQFMFEKMTGKPYQNPVTKTA